MTGKKYLIYVDSYVGNLGTKILIEEKRNILSEHFSITYLDKVLYDINSSMKEGDNLSLLDCIYDKEMIETGGFLTALWKISDRNKMGLKYNLCDVPVLQGTIEIANFFDINPYRLLTEGSHIIFSEKEIKDMIFIGETNDTKKRLRVDGETEAFLTKDYKDEIDKIIPNYIKGASNK